MSPLTYLAMPRRSSCLVLLLSCLARQPPILFRILAERKASELQPVVKAIGQASVGQYSRLVRSESHLHARGADMLKRTRVHACLARGTFSTIPLSPLIKSLGATSAANNAIHPPSLLAALPTSLVRLLVHLPCAGQSPVWPKDQPRSASVFAPRACLLACQVWG